MRTTITLNDALLDELKYMAADRETTLSQVIEDLLQIALAQEEQISSEPQPFRLITSGAGGVFPVYEKVWDLIDDDDIERLHRAAG